jgi:hypothetical protein
MALDVHVVDVSRVTIATKRNFASVSVLNASKRLARKMKLALDAIACGY